MIRMGLSMAPRTRALSATTATLLVVIVVLAGSLVFVTLTPQPVSHSTVTITQAHTMTTTETTTVILTPTTPSNTNASTDAALLATCSQAQGPPPGIWKLAVNTNSAAVICFQLYYYSSTAPLSLNLSQALSIQALQYIANGSVNYPRSFSGASNFTLVASQNQLTIGGPSSANEGTTIAYALTAKPGASGTYWLSFLASNGLRAYMASPQEPLSCAFYGELVAGTGQPGYTQGFNGCITYTTTSQTSTSAATNSTSGNTVPGIPYPLLNGNIYFRITGMRNSTQIGGIG